MIVNPLFNSEIIRGYHAGEHHGRMTYQQIKKLKLRTDAS